MLLQAYVETTKLHAYEKVNVWVEDACEVLGPGFNVLGRWIH